MICDDWIPKFISRDAYKRGYRISCGGGGCADYLSCNHPNCVKSVDAETGLPIAIDEYCYIHEDQLFDLYEDIKDARKLSDAAVIARFWGEIGE